MLENAKGNTIWVEKHRPDTLEGYVGNPALKQQFSRFISENDVPHLLLSGRAGTGKTTAAKILINRIDCESVIINASDENNIDTVRSKIRGFVSSVGFRPMKIMVLDEFDYFSQAGQAALRNLMEQFSDTARFILTANYVERIIPPILSRVQHIEVVPPSKKEVAIHVAGILKKESVEFRPTDLKLLVEAYFPDIRRIINQCQLQTRDGKLEVDRAAVVENDFRLKIVETLGASVSKKDKFTAIRQLIADAHVRDFTDCYRMLYDTVERYAVRDGISTAILAIAEGQYRDALVVDKEIAFMATIINLLQAAS